MRGYVRSVGALTLLFLAAGLSAPPKAVNKVKAITFRGITALDPARLKAALATKESSILLPHTRRWRMHFSIGQAF